MTSTRNPTPTKSPEPAADAKRKGRAGPVLATYRLGLKGLDAVTVGVGGFALGSLGRLGLPDRFARTLKSGQAGAIHGATRVSDTVGTAAAKTVGKGVSAASGAAKFLFP